MRFFNFDEFVRSETARRRGINNEPPAAVRANIEALVDKVLDPLREAWGGPVTVTSGYRCAALNAAVGGASRSQHMTGQAADITVGSQADNRRLFQLIMELGLPFDQLIDEKGFSWVHVSYDPSRNRRQVLRL